MKEFDNVEMTEEEVDQVAGGLKTVTIERPKDGHTSIPMYIQEDGVSSNLTSVVQRFPTDPDLEEKRRKYPGVIFS